MPDQVNQRALDESLRRFPRVLQACARFHYDAARRMWLNADGCVPAIIAEYRLIAGGAP